MDSKLTLLGQACPLIDKSAKGLLSAVGFLGLTAGFGAVVLEILLEFWALEGADSVAKGFFCPLFGEATE